MFYAVVDRFGYEYMTIGRTKKAVKETMSKWYLDTYKLMNDGADPRKDFDYHTDISNYDVFMDELGINEIKYNEVTYI